MRHAAAERASHPGRRLLLLVFAAGAFFGARWIAAQLTPPSLSLAWSRDGRTIAVGGQRADVRLWSVPDGRSLRTLTTTAFAGDVYGCRRAPGDRGPDDPLELNRIMADRYLRVVVGASSGASDLAFGTNGMLFVMTSGSSRSIGVWDPDAGWQRRAYAGTADDVHLVAFSADGTRLAGETADHGFAVWNAAGGRPVRRFPAEARAARAFTLSPDGRLLARVGRDRTVRVWDVGTGRELLRAGHLASAVAVRFDRDGRRIAFIDRDGLVQVWDIASRRLFFQIDARPGAATAIDPGPDGRLFALGTDGGWGELWDLEAGRRVRRLEGGTAPLTAIAFSPDGRLVAAGSAGGGMLHIWEAGSGRELLTLNEPRHSAVRLPP